MSASRIAILGAGPVGLDAALAAAEAGWPFTIYEQGGGVGEHVRRWGHVRLFSPWSLDLSPRMERALAGAGLEVPGGDGCPTGDELCRRVLAPLGDLLRPHLRLGARVAAVGRRGLLKHEEIASEERARRPFRLLVEEDGAERCEEADVVIDCTGTYGQPAWLGDGGVPAPGERALGDAVVRHLPDLERDAVGWAGKTVLLAGGGHSAWTAARDLARLAGEAGNGGGRVVWLLREEPAWGPEADELAERGRLRDEARALYGGASPAVEALRGSVELLAPGAEGRGVRATVRTADGGAREVAADRVLALAGYVGDLDLYRQLQVHTCYATEGPMKLSAALLGAGAGDCLEQTGHGVETLLNPEPGFFVLGIKSYGRHNTFLMRSGYRQVDEVFGHLAGGGR